MTEVFLNLTEFFFTLTEVLPCFFLSCMANARVKLAKTGHGPHSSTLVVFVLFGCYLCCSMYCLCVLPPGDNPIALNKYINISKCANESSIQGFQVRASSHIQMNQ